jgi:ferredoxin-NADP reductase
VDREQALIGAAMAGAKLYTAKELKRATEGNRELIGRIPQKLVLAARHRRKTRSADDERIALESFSPITKKPKPAARRQKQGTVARKSRNL